MQIKIYVVGHFLGLYKKLFVLSYSCYCAKYRLGTSPKTLRNTLVNALGLL